MVNQLAAAFKDGDNGIPVSYRFDGKLFNLRRLQAKFKEQTEVLDEFLFAADMANGAPTDFNYCNKALTAKLLR